MWWTKNMSCWTEERVQTCAKNLWSSSIKFGDYAGSLQRGVLDPNAVPAPAKEGLSGWVRAAHDAWVHDGTPATPGGGPAVPREADWRRHQPAGLHPRHEQAAGSHVSHLQHPPPWTGWVPLWLTLYLSVTAPYWQLVICCCSSLWCWGVVGLIVSQVNSSCLVFCRFVGEGGKDQIFFTYHRNKL